MIQIIDYGAGNLASVANALTKLGQEYEIISSPIELRDDSKIIFPGVGAAGSAMAMLRATGFDAVLPTITRPFLGICLGMQLLMPYSEENDTACLDIVDGEARKFTCDLKVPQIGWNTATKLCDDPLFAGIPDDAYFYFVNSYCVETPYAISQTDYGYHFASALKKDNFYGVQFHPEKSGEVGLRLLLNFCEL